MNNKEMYDKGLCYVYTRNYDTGDTSRLIVTQAWAEEHREEIHETKADGFLKWIEYPDDWGMNKYRITFRRGATIENPPRAEEREVPAHSFKEAYESAMNILAYDYEEIVKIELVSVYYG
jgi:acyl-CoA hydrolase